MLQRLNRWLIGRLPSRRAAAASRLAVTPKGLEIVSDGNHRLVRWSEIERVVAFRAEQLVGDRLGLAFSRTDGPAFTITEDDPAWRQLVDGLTDGLPGAKRYPVWGPELLASAGELEVYRR